MTISHPAGFALCDACGRDDAPTVSVQDFEGWITACERCREPFEKKGAVTARAIELAISKTTGGKVAARDAMIRAYRAEHDVEKYDGDQAMLLDIGRGDAAEERRKARRRAA